MERPTDEPVFEFQAGPKPPARPAESIPVQFPAPDKPVAPPKHGPLRVLRTQPSGKVSSVAAITVTFNQPMIPLTSLDLQRSFKSPMEISPKPPGKIRWLGTTTVAYESKSRFPFSTRYEVTVPAGTVSAVGGRLAESVRFSFQTPTVRLTRFLPAWTNHALPETPIVLFFNQEVRPEDVLAKTKLLAHGKRPVALRLVPKDQWGDIKLYGKKAKTWDQKRTVVLVPANDLELATSYSIVIEGGLASAEGPLRTPHAHRYEFRTYGPMKADFAGCWGRKTLCEPGIGLFVWFTNNIKSSDEKLAKLIRITPPVADLAIHGSGNRAYLSGNFQPATTYRVTVRPGIDDIYGQKSAKSWSGRFRLKNARPALSFPVVRDSGVLESNGPRTLAVRSINITQATVTLVAIPPDKLVQAARILHDSSWKDRKLGLARKLPGRKVRFSYRFNHRKNRFHTSYLKMDRALHHQGGTVFVEVYSPNLRLNRWSNPRRYFLVQVTDIGLTARYDVDRIVALTSSLGESALAPDVSLSLYALKGPASGHAKPLWTGKSSPSGTVTIPGPRKMGESGPYVLIARTKREFSFLFLDGSGQDGWIPGYGSYQIPRYRIESFVTTDRNPYRAGETVHLTGMVRRRRLDPNDRLDKVEGNLTMDYRILDPRGEKVASGKTRVDQDGTFHVVFRSNPDAKLGTYGFRGKLHGATNVHDGSGVTHFFKILAYRTPEYEVTVSTSPGPKLLGTKGRFSVLGKYLFGASMGGAKVHWTLSRSATVYRPPHHDTFTFGVAPYRPWAWIWRTGRRAGRWGWYFESQSSHGGIIEKGDGRLDDRGNLSVSVRFDRGKGKKRLPSTGRFTFEAQVFDVNRQSIASRKTVLVHPASLYVGTRWHQAVVQAGSPARLDLVAVDLDGKRVANRPIAVKAMRTIWSRKMVKDGRYWKAKYEAKQVVEGRCHVTSAQSVQTCALTLNKPGEYEVIAETTDRTGRKTITSTIMYVAGKGYVPWRTNNESRLELVADKAGYDPGQRAKILIKNPYRHAVGLMTVEHRGIVSYRVLDLKESSHVETIRISKRHIPDLHVSVVLLRGRVRVDGRRQKGKDEDLGRPMFATGHIKLPVAKKSRIIRVSVKPARKDIRPGQTLKVTLTAMDYQGRPIRAKMAVFVVDEGVLSLLGFKTPDPRLVFLTDAGRGTAVKTLRALLLKKEQLRLSHPPSPPKMNGQAVRALRRPKRALVGRLEAAPAPTSSVAGLPVDDVRQSPRFVTRTHFATTAYVNTDVTTDHHGTAQVTIPMPDNLTAFRIMAMALDRDRPDRFGSGQARVRVNKKLLLRPALPRFANFGDRFDASVVVNNETGKAGVVTVHMDAVNVRILGPKTKRVFVDAGKASEVRFAVATTRPGLARFRFSALLGKETDSVQPPPIHVNLPATTEATATYGVTESSVAQPLLAPKNILPRFGAVEISLSSTALTGLQDAASFLVDYPFECTEQTASRLIPIFVLGDILAQFHIGKVSDRKKQRELAKAGIKSLLARQRWNGGFVFWQGNYRVSPYASVYAAWALTQAVKSGHRVPTKALLNAAKYVRKCMEGRVGWPWSRWWSFRAMAAWVLADMKTLPSLASRLRKWSLSPTVATIFRQKNKLALFAKAMLMATAKRLAGPSSRTMIRSLKQDLDNAAVQTASSAHFAERVTKSLRLLLHSKSRTDAIVLAAFMETHPNDPLIPKIVRGLTSARVKGRWETTQANAFAMYALSTYFRRYEKEPPDFVAQLWLGAGYVGSKRFQGRSMAVSETKIPIGVLLEQTKTHQGETSLVLAKRGTGRLYYRLAMHYAPTSLRLAPEEQGFSVSRVYEPVENPKSVRRDAKGIWHVKAGSYVRVRLTMVVPDRRYYTALVDPLPAGFEIVDINLQTTASSSLAHKAKNRVYDFWSWYALRSPDHKEMRDDAYQVFWDRLPSGVYEYTYLARATTIGTFVVPPLKAEEMYHPETFGRNGTHIVIVDP